MQIRSLMTCSNHATILDAFCHYTCRANMSTVHLYANTSLYLCKYVTILGANMSLYLCKYVANYLCKEVTLLCKKYDHYDLCPKVCPTGTCKLNSVSPLYLSVNMSPILKCKYVTILV